MSILFTNTPLEGVLDIVDLELIKKIFTSTPGTIELKKPKTKKTTEPNHIKKAVSIMKTYAKMIYHPGKRNDMK